MLCFACAMMDLIFLKEINIKDKKVIPLKLFRKMTAEEVTDWYEARISTYGTGYSSKILEEKRNRFR